MKRLLPRCPIRSNLCDLQDIVGRLWLILQWRGCKTQLPVILSCCVVIGYCSSCFFSPLSPPSLPLGITPARLTFIANHLASVRLNVMMADVIYTLVRFTLCSLVEMYSLNLTSSPSAILYTLQSHARWGWFWGVAFLGESILGIRYARTRLNLPEQ